MSLRPIHTLPDEVLRRKARPVTRFDDKLPRRGSSPGLQTLIDDMIETMRNAPGVGLAAPQVNVSERVIVVEYAKDPDLNGESVREVTPEAPPRSCAPGPSAAEVINPGGTTPELRSGAFGGRDNPGFRDKPKLYIMVNPEVTRSSTETEVGVEGCLSVPGLVGEVERSLAITVKGQNRRGQTMRLKVEGWLARIFQHEIDHLNGVLFTDRATHIWQPEEPIEDNTGKPA